MKISKTEAFFLNSVLFAFRTDANKVLRSNDLDDLEDLEDRLRSCYLESSLTDSDHKEELSDDNDNDDDEDDDDNEAESSTDKPEVPEVANWLADTEVDKLQPANVSYSDGSMTSLEFERCGNPDTIDAILDCVIIPGIHAIELSKDSINIWEPECGWHTFKFVKKCPKSWSRLLKTGLVYGVSTQAPAEDEQSDEDE